MTIISSINVKALLPIILPDMQFPYCCQLSYAELCGSCFLKASPHACFSIFDAFALV
jgi:hypothetical protein